MVRKAYRKLDRHDRRLLAKILAADLGTSEAVVNDKLSQPWTRRALASGSWLRWDVPKGQRRASVLQKPSLAIQLQFSSSELRLILQIARSDASSPE